MTDGKINPDTTSKDPARGQDCRLDSGEAGHAEPGDMTGHKANNAALGNSCAKVGARKYIIKFARRTGKYNVPGYFDYAGENDDWPESEVETPPGSRFILKAVALLTAICFLGIVTLSFWPDTGLNLPDMVKESQLLKKNVDNSILQSVVQITVIHRGPGAPVPAGQRTGTGFNVRPDGTVITNYHVIEGALNISVNFPDGKVYKATGWRSKPESDLAVISLEADGLPVIKLNTSAPAPGDKIRVLGNPRALKNILVEGKVGAYLKVKGIEGKVFSIEAPIFPGNSGSPVLDTKGRAVGIVFGSTRAGEGSEERIAGLALSIEAVQEFLQGNP